MTSTARVLVADPPWQFGDSLTMSSVKRGASTNYGTLSLAELKTFPLPYPVGEDALLFLWRVAAMQEEALAVMRAWGFVPKSEIVWVKTTGSGKLHFGMGHYVRASHEVCLIGRRGKAKVRNRSTRSVFEAPVGRHSAKPEVFFDLVEQLAEGPYVELFARRERIGWHCYGNELTQAEESA